MLKWFSVTCPTSAVINSLCFKCKHLSMKKWCISLEELQEPFDPFLWSPFQGSSCAKRWSTCADGSGWRVTCTTRRTWGENRKSQKSSSVTVTNNWSLSSTPPSSTRSATESLTSNPARSLSCPNTGSQSTTHKRTTDTHTAAYTHTCTQV